MNRLLKYKNNLNIDLKVTDMVPLVPKCLNYNLTK